MTKTCPTGYKLQADWYSKNVVFQADLSGVDTKDYAARLPRVTESPASRAALEKYRQHRASCPDCGGE